MRSSVRSRATQLATGQEILSLCRLQATSSSPAAITLPQLQLENRTARNISQGKQFRFHLLSNCLILEPLNHIL
jgi:hypothetical protein